MTKEVASGVYEIETRYKAAKAYLIAENELTLVDTGLRGSEGSIKKAAEHIGRSVAEITEIVITHCHVDHAGSAAALKAITGARVSVHRADADYLSGALPLPYPRERFATRLFCMLLLPLLKYKGLVADGLLEEGIELKALGGLRVMHTPGHSPGHVCLYAPERRLFFPGDIVAARGDNLALPGKTYTTDWDRAHASLGRLRGLQVEILCASHGGTVAVDVQEKLGALLDRAKA